MVVAMRVGQRQTRDRGDKSQGDESFWCGPGNTKQW